MNPKSITYHSKSRELEIWYEDTESIVLSAEYLRVFSPSAEVRGHSTDQRVLQTGKKDVAINSIEPIGNYAIRIVFSDGHDSGIYSWSYLRELSENFSSNWNQYLSELAATNSSRLSTIPLGSWSPPT
ncbi:MAG: DUF971 domain-containing protein [Gammaproteobacteria bacterium]|nr:DUF971 domain-containing protein [Gammaproteobacteria bacterium]MYC25597.1 DUF971 domain-containing protein [Gammaproteobacteria bacterium]